MKRMQLSDDRRRVCKPTPASAIIARKRADVIESYKFTRGKNCNWARSLTRLARAAAQEYEERFLIELIQNGYDVHESQRSDGCIWIQFAKDEGDFGTLYVGNGGRAFSESNFLAICEIAQSDKEPGEGIGNKGVGFKSVLHVCDSPEVYSVNPDSGGSRQFDGFCFRFARDDDFPEFCNGDATLLAALRRDVSPYFLPVHIPVIPQSVERFREHGMVTVIRMPLRQLGKAIVARQLDELLTSPVPALLFLPRLARLVVEVIENGETFCAELHRREADLLPASSECDCRWSRVTLERRDENSEEGRPPQEFFVASKVVEEHRLIAAIRESIEENQLDERFAEWKQDAVVAVAAEMGGDTPMDCRLYTFLQMGKEAQSPCGGHLNAPFAPNLARTHVNAAIPLNSLFFDIAAEICATSLLRFSNDPTGMSEAVLLDLLTWNDAYKHRLASAFSAQGSELASVPFLDLVAADGLPRRGSIDEAFQWEGSFRVFTPQFIRTVTGAQILERTYGPRRQARFAKFVDSLGYTLTPDSSTLADWTEQIAARLAKKRVAASQWNGFYADVAAIFSACSDALEGRKFLLDSSGSLRQAGPFRGAMASSDKPVVFFPPTTERSEDDEDVGSVADVAIPKKLWRYLSYMQERVQWYEKEGTSHRRTAARDFLQRAHLVQKFDTRSLVDLCSKISEHSKSNAVRQSAIKFAFRLQKAARSSEGLGLDRLPFQVPVRGGWTLAENAIFSVKWRGSRGPDLEALIANARSVSDDIEALEERLLIEPHEQPFRDGAIAEWRDFLIRLGVQDGLAPIELPITQSTFQGNAVTIVTLGRAMKLKEADIEKWKTSFARWPTASFPYTDYRLESPFYRIPGQFAFDAMTGKAKNIYARLIFAAIGSWDEAHFTATIERPRPSGKDTLLWPTPLATFVMNAAWIPVLANGMEERFVRPEEAWHVAANDEDAPPAYLPLLARDLRRGIEDDRAVYKRLILNGRLRVVGRAKDAPSLLKTLGDLLADEKIGDSDTVSFRRLYLRSWQQMIDTEAVLRDDFTKAPNLFIAVGRGTQQISLQIRKESKNCCNDDIYVIDSDDVMHRRLLLDLNLLTLDAGAERGHRVAELLEELCGECVRRSSAVTIEVLADGKSVSPQATHPFLFDETNKWIKELIAFVIALKSPVQLDKTQHCQTEVQRRLSTIRVVRAKGLSVRVDDTESDLPPSFHGVISINDSDFPTIALATGEQAFSWRTLERLVPALMGIIDRTSVEAELTLAICRLERLLPSGMIEEPSDDDLAEVLRTSVNEVTAHRRELGTSGRALIDFLYPVVSHFAGPELAVKFDPATTEYASRDDLRIALVALQDQLPLPIEEMLAIAEHAPDLWSIRDQLHIDYGGFNATLRRIGSPYRPALNEDGHRNEFEYFKHVNADAISTRLRATFLDEYRSGHSLQKYVDMRELQSLQPDALWLDICHLPSDAMMRARVNAWLVDVGASSLDDVSPDLTQLAAVRAANRKIVRDLCLQLTTLVPVWCAKTAIPVPASWNYPDVVEVIGDALLNEGLVDFERISPARLFRWLDERNYWPENMPHSTTLEDLGLSDHELSTFESEADKRRRQQEFERRTIVIDGTRFSAEAADCQSLIDKVRSSITPEFLSMKKGISKLAVVDKRDGTSRKGPHRDAARSPITRMTDSQRQAVGLVGELLAFEWLKTHYEGVTEACWKSKYRNLVFGGATGDDGLGFDFEVFLKNGSTHMFEVKATTGEDATLELGASELEISQRFSRTKSNPYRLLFISNVLDATRRQIVVLPNPFSKHGRGFFETTGTGIRYRFRLDQST